MTWIQHQNSDIIWIGTEHGLFALHLGTLRVVPMKELMNVYVRSLHIPANQNEVWISTFRDGLFLLKNNRLTKFPLDRMKQEDNLIELAYNSVEERGQNL